MTTTMTEERCDTLHASFTLPATLRSAALARKMTAAALASWECAADCDVTLLLVDEVFVNAVLHGVGELGQAARITVELLPLTSARLRVAIHDPNLGDGDGVKVRHPDTEAENGHGLELVEALSVSWGCEETAVGKYVYFELESRTEPDCDRSSCDADSRLGLVGR